MKDRNKPNVLVKAMLVRDCAWGLDITSVAMHYVPEVMVDDLHEWSFSFILEIIFLGRYGFLLKNLG